MNKHLNDMKTEQSNRNKKTNYYGIQLFQFIKDFLGSTFRYSVMLFVTIISLLPFIWIFISSFKTNMEVLNSAFSWPADLSFRNYVTAINTVKLPMYFMNSLIVVIVSTILGLLIFSMAAYVLARFEFRGRNFIYFLLASSLLVPMFANIQPIYILIHFLNLYDTKTGLTLVYTSMGLALALFIMKSYFTNLPKELEESAYIEGGNFFTTFIWIILPISLPAISSAAVILFISAWNEFLFALLLTSSESNRTLSVSLAYFVMGFQYNYPALFSALIMIMLPSIIIYVFLQEQISKSFITGAVKG